MGGTSFRTTDVDEACAVLERLYAARLRVGRDAGEVALSMRERRAGEFALVTMLVGPDLEFDLVERDEVIFTTLLAGELEFRRAGSLGRYGPGDVFAELQPDVRGRARAFAAHTSTVALPRRVLDDVAANEPGAPPAPWRFAPARLAEDAAERWRRTTRLVGRTLAGLDDSFAPLVVGAATRMLASTALITFPNDAINPDDATPGTPEAVRRAVAFIDAHPLADLSVQDVAGAAHVTVRELQRAFRRDLDTTPLAYLRAVRLAQAHDELRAADPGTETVAAVARRWGFGDVARFHRRYRAEYGCSPEDTLTS